MRLLRLYIQVLPRQDSGLPNGDPRITRPEAILPWIEPCTEDISLQELSERIISRFASIYPGNGYVFWILCSRVLATSSTNSLLHLKFSVLNIECLQNHCGYILDMPLTVGEVFDDLPGSTDISRLIVKVVRSPPTPDELGYPLRYVSLAPESSARPQKRRLTHAEPIWDNQQGGEHAQSWGSGGLTNDDGRASKRRKIQNLVPNTPFGSDRPTFPTEGLQDGVYNSSQTTVERLSPRGQIVDYPGSSSRKRMYVIFERNIGLIV